MNGMRKKLAVGAAAGLLAVVMAMPAYGAKRTAITSITLTIKADIEPNTDFGSENIEIETNSSRFSVDGYEVMNTGFEWTSDTVPEIRITLTAEDDYYFKALPKDKIKLKGGAEFVKGTRQDSSSTLLMDVKLPSLQNTLQDLETVQLSEDGVATWTTLANAGEYEVKVYRDGNAVGTVMKTQSGSINCRERMVKGNASYTVKIRPVNKYETDTKGDWMESNSVYISAEKAAQFRDNPSGGTGKWEQAADGRWWYSSEDGSYPVNTWLLINGKWYFFDQEGYMKTGWVQWEGKEYYCSENGDMLTNCLTPDNYLVGTDGAKIAQQEDVTKETEPEVDPDEEMQKEWERLSGKDDE